MWAGGDLAYVRGQEHAKKTMGVAAAEGHNLLMSGPPGSGETFLACSLLSILPTMSSSESLKLTEIYSVAGLLPSDTPLIMHRPFRAWHYTISHAGLVRGGRLPHPGEVTLSYRRVLLLDELPEFGHIVLEVLRKPLEDRAVTISQAQGSVTFPANFMLVAAMNPCYCSYYGDPKKRCTCSYSMVTKYRKRISGPLLDCIDIFVEVPRVEYNDLTGEALGEESSVVRQRVGKASERQRQRFVGTGIRSNADMGPAEVREHCKLDNAAQGLAKAAMEQLHLSARAFHRTLKLSRTIADLADAEEIGVAHVAEAVQYRPKRQG